MKYILIILIFAFFSFSLEAKVIEKRVSGFAISKQKAVTNALIEAVSQTKGVEIRSLETMRSQFYETFSSHNGKDDEYTFAADASGGAVSKITKGIIQGYDIVEITRVDRGYEAIVDVRMSIYKAPGISHKSRRKIAIMPFYYAQKSFNIGHNNYSGYEMSDMITHALTTSFTQTRKFAVVDRTYTRDMAKELNLIGSQRTSLSQKVKLGQTLGADYLLVGTIKKAAMQRHTSQNQLLGTSSSKDVAEFIIDYRIIVVGTSQIKWSDTAKAIIDVDSHGSPEMRLQNAVEKISAAITNSLLGNIYPVRIAQITRSGEIVLNQGGNTMSVGLRLDVMHVGEKIIDPYTGESLGSTESKAAEIEVTRVTSKLSYAKIVEGSFKQLKKNDICRRQSAGSKSAAAVQDNSAWRKSNVKVNNNGGGVKLPFD